MLYHAVCPLNKFGTSQETVLFCVAAILYPPGMVVWLDCGLYECPSFPTFESFWAESQLHATELLTQNDGQTTTVGGEDVARCSKSKLSGLIDSV